MGFQTEIEGYAATRRQLQFLHIFLSSFLNVTFHDGTVSILPRIDSIFDVFCGYKFRLLLLV